MGRLLTFVLLVTVLGSCATVHRNGYIQSRSYNHVKHKRKKSTQPRIRVFSNVKVQINHIEPQRAHNIYTDSLQNRLTPSPVRSEAVPRLKNLVEQGTSSDKFSAPKRQYSGDLINTKSKGTDAVSDGQLEDPPKLHWAAFLSLAAAIFVFLWALTIPFIGIGGYFFALCSGVAAILFGKYAQDEILAFPKKYKGKVIAQIGKAIGLITVSLFVIGAGLFLVWVLAQ